MRTRPTRLPPILAAGEYAHQGHGRGHGRRRALATVLIGEFSQNSAEFETVTAGVLRLITPVDVHDHGVFTSGVADFEAFRDVFDR